MKLFPECKIHPGKQREPWWYEIRKDKLTASQAGAWLAERPECRLTVAEIKAELDRIGEPYKASETRPMLLAALTGRIGGQLPLTHLKSTTDARHTAICKILGSLSPCQAPDQWEVDPDGPPPRNPSLWAIWNGIRQEPAAIADFERATGETVTQVGFCTHRTGVAGCSPDGLIEGKNIGFEGKAPLPSTHVRYLLNQVLPDEYVDQINFSMAVTGADGWWFQSFCQGLPSFRILTERNEYTERMFAGIEEFAIHLQSAREEIGSIFQAALNEQKARLEGEQ